MKIIRLILVTMVSALITIGVFSATAQAMSQNERVFREVIKKEYSYINTNDAVAVAKNFCKLSDNLGVKKAKLGMLALAFKKDIGEETAFIIGAGTPAFCPRHLKALSKSPTI